jgi:chromosome segregation ATPase
MMAEALAATAGQLAADMESLSKSVIDISASIDAVATKLERLRTPDGVIEVRLDPVIATLTGAVDRFAAESDRQAETCATRSRRKGAAESSSASIAALREHVDSSSAASRAAIEAAKESSDAVTQVLDQFKANAWGQIQMLRSILEQTDRAFHNFAEAIVQSASDMAAAAPRFNDILMRIDSSRESSATATERLRSRRRRR